LHFVPKLDQPVSCGCLVECSLQSGENAIGIEIEEVGLSIR
jgi:hypothetical protein